MNEQKYETLELDLDDDIQKTMIDIFVKKTTTDLEWEMYNDLLAEGWPIEICLYRVAINAVVHQALVKQVEQMKSDKKIKKKSK